MSELPSIFDFQTEVIDKNGKCVSCQTPFVYGDIAWYEHEGGTEVKESPNKLWIYFECQNCEYQSALWKVEKQLGLDAEYVEEQLDEIQKPKMEELWDNEEDEGWDIWNDEEGLVENIPLMDEPENEHTGKLVENIPLMEEEELVVLDADLIPIAMEQDEIDELKKKIAEEENE